MIIDFRVTVPRPEYASPEKMAERGKSRTQRGYARAYKGLMQEDWKTSMIGIAIPFVYGSSFPTLTLKRLSCFLDRSGVNLPGV